MTTDTFYLITIGVQVAIAIIYAAILGVMLYQNKQSAKQLKLSQEQFQLSNKQFELAEKERKRNEPHVTFVFEYKPRKIHEPGKGKRFNYPTEIACIIGNRTGRDLEFEGKLYFKRKQTKEDADYAKDQDIAQGKYIIIGYNYNDFKKIRLSGTSVSGYTLIEKDGHHKASLFIEAFAKQDAKGAFIKDSSGKDWKIVKRTFNMVREYALDREKEERKNKRDEK